MVDDISSIPATPKFGIEVSDAVMSPVPPVEPSISSARPDTGSHTDVPPNIRTAEAAPEISRKPAARKSKRRRTRHRGGPINLGAREDRAWLGAIIVGEGSWFNVGPPGKRKRVPTLAIMMGDRAAMDKVAKLIGVSRVRAGSSPITGRPYWRVCALGARAIQVLDLTRPFLTQEELGQAERVISRARRAGFKTLDEIREETKLRVLQQVRKHPGLNARFLRGMGLDGKLTKRYLEQLEKEGLVRRVEGRPGGKRLKTNWFPIPVSARTIAPAARTDSGYIKQEPWLDWPAAQLEMSKLRGIENLGKSGFRGRRAGSLNLERTENKAWLAALIIGEGSVYLRFRYRGTTTYPCLAIRMQDKEAIDRAGFLMGVRTCAAGISPSSKRPFWIVCAVGGRAMEIIGKIREFLTPTKIMQAERVLEASKRSGYRTKMEMWENRKNVVLEYIRAWPGSYSSYIGRNTNCAGSQVKRALEELEKEGKVVRMEERESRRPRSRWFPKG
jgi:DNA-binding MarR family transcriptional regulator